MSDVRRCRRCKRKRMDDEPPEVKQYKTCAKCRIIERQKKKSRKPLAEETVLYGMKQFQQQNQNTSFLKDDFNYDSDYKNLNVNNSYQYNYVYDGNGGSIPPGTTIGGTSTATAASIPQTYNLNYQLVAQKVLPIQSTSLPNDYNTVVNCEVCDKKLDPSDELTMNYQLCVECYSNPFQLNNVFEDYNQFLLKIGDNNQKDIVNYIFLKEIDKNFIDSLNSIVQYNNEYKFREHVLDNLSKIYLDPIIASTTYKFVSVSSNLNDLGPQAGGFKNKPIKAYYKCKDEISNKINCKSGLFMDYNLSNNILKVKFTHKVHNIFKLFPPEFVKLLAKIITDLNINEFNAQTGELVYNEVTNQNEFGEVVDGINKDEFIQQFHHLELVIKELDDTKKASSPLIEIDPEVLATSDPDSVDDNEPPSQIMEPIEKILDPAFN